MRTWPVDFEQSPRRVLPVARVPTVPPSVDRVPVVRRYAVRPRGIDVRPPREPMRNTRIMRYFILTVGIKFLLATNGIYKCYL